MEEVLRWLGGAAVVIAGSPITWAEVLGSLTGLACVVLVARHVSPGVGDRPGRVIEDVAPLDQLGVYAIGG